MLLLLKLLLLLALPLLLLKPILASSSYIRVVFLIVLLVVLNLITLSLQLVMVVRMVKISTSLETLGELDGVTKVTLRLLLSDQVLVSAVSNKFLSIQQPIEKSNKLSDKNEITLNVKFVFVLIYLLFCQFL